MFPKSLLAILFGQPPASPFLQRRSGVKSNPYPGTTTRDVAHRMQDRSGKFIQLAKRIEGMYGAHRSKRRAPDPNDQLRVEIVAANIGRPAHDKLPAKLKVIRGMRRMAPYNPRRLAQAECVMAALA